MTKWTAGQGPAEGYHDDGDVDVSYAVQWKTTEHPGRWKYYTRYWPTYEKALSSLQAASQIPGVIELRIIEKRQSYRVLEGEAITEHQRKLEGAKHEQAENTDLQRGRSRRNREKEGRLR